ncbi:alpha/beta family hydrolase [Alteromonas sp. A079]|uniref:alpha/beta family hydrolase n=1 Tax=Alteromonas sp. A079 TaxID=3410268 RepID=UPI003B9DD5F7
MFDIDVIDCPSPIARLILAHGAGAGKEHDFMQRIAQRLAEQHIEVVLFNFPYMQVIKDTGKRRPPDKAEKLLMHFSEVVDNITADRAPLPTFIGGKSMGGRMATMLLDTLNTVTAAVALGYPFHPPGKPEKTRTEHLLTLRKQLLVVQGERDTFGNKDEVVGYNLPANIALHFLKDGDHSFKPRKASGESLDSHLDSAVSHVTTFVKAHINE